MTTLRRNLLETSAAIAALVASLCVVGCDDGPGPNEGSSASSQVEAAQRKKNQDCETWCATKRKLGCGVTGNPEASCQTYCASVGPCGDAAEVIACHAAHPEVFHCALSPANSLFALPPCNIVLGTYEDSAQRCVVDSALATDGAAPGNGAAGGPP